jgi:uracil-DNA glycosylase
LNETAPTPHPEYPKALRDADERARRQALLGDDHVAPLVAYGTQLAERTGKAVPLDGGVNARLLILLETPGPRVLGTGFVSRDNPSGTAANMFRFLTNAGIARADTVIWNIVPWLIQTPGERNRNPSRGDVAEGLAHLPDFLDLLPRLELAILAGRKAESAVGLLEAREIPCLTMPHPSPTYVYTSPDVALRISVCLGKASERLAVTRNSAMSPS